MARLSQLSNHIIDILKSVARLCLYIITCLSTGENCIESKIIRMVSQLLPVLDADLLRKLSNGWAQRDIEGPIRVHQWR